MGDGADSARRTGFRSSTWLPTRWALWSLPPACSALVVVYTSACLAAAGAAFWRDPGVLWSISVHQLEVLVLCFAAALATTRNFTRSSRTPLNVPGVLIDSCWLVPVVLLLPPVFGMLFVFCSAQPQGTPPFKRVANHATSSLGAYVAGSVMFALYPGGLHLGSLAGGGGRTAPILAALGVGVLFDVVDTVATLSLIATATRTSLREAFDPDRSTYNELAVTAFGVTVALLTQVSLLAVVAVVPMVLALARSSLLAGVAELARTDAKTGLLNEPAWREASQRVLDRADVDGSTTSVLMVDLDKFKDVNDTHGHLVGDQLLAGVAQEMGRWGRPADLLGRFGGEEFVVLLPETSREAAVHAAERLRLAVADLTIELEGGGVLRRTASIGVASSVPGLQGTGLDRLVYAADEAMYLAKGAGRNRVVAAKSLEPLAAQAADLQKLYDVGSDTGAVTP